MADQATLNKNPSASLNGMMSGIGDVGSDVVTLAALQARLAGADLHETAVKAQPALAAAAILVPVGFASTTVLLLGLACKVAARWGISIADSLLLVAALGILIAAFLSILAVGRLRSSLVSFRRSREELERNLAWLRTVLVHSGR